MQGSVILKIHNTGRLYGGAVAIQGQIQGDKINENRRDPRFAPRPGHFLKYRMVELWPKPPADFLFITSKLNIFCWVPSPGPKLGCLGIKKYIAQEDQLKYSISRKE